MKSKEKLNLPPKNGNWTPRVSKKARWSAGPWTVEEGLVIRGKEMQQIAKVGSEGSMTDAKLISLAPVMAEIALLVALLVSKENPFGGSEFDITAEAIALAKFVCAELYAETPTGMLQ